ncbi:hypothetical protein [Duganella radicis]|uniref:Uncharacterized protein n=1 Tax=Duganella radicis TaxID=551988 RepID=A0A6L6PP10_9BURK|nr:hypothetical protein [Duganella radicis]MTV40830.1 hypothetical protein [Duganella radicis]
MSEEAVKLVLQDWRVRGIEKPRAILPLEETQRILRTLRRNACRAAGVRFCDCWQVKPAVAAETGMTALIGVDEPERVEYVGPAFSADPATVDPCFGCRTPAVSRMEFSVAVFGKEVREKELGAARVNPKVFSRPMSAGNLYRVLAAAFFQGWVTLAQARSMFDRAVQLDATSEVVRRFVKRLRARKSFVETGAIKEQPASLFDEIEAVRVSILVDMEKAGRRKVAASKELDDEVRDWLLATDLPQKLS